MMNIWSSSLTLDAMMAQQGNQKCIESWKGLVDSAKLASENTQSVLEKMGYQGGFIINVLNSESLDKTLLSVAYGIVIYDFLDE